jgi:hypothetical protein
MEVGKIEFSAARHDSQKVLLGRMRLETRSVLIQTMIGDDTFHFLLYRDFLTHEIHIYSEKICHFVTTLHPLP